MTSSMLEAAGSPSYAARTPLEQTQHDVFAPPLGLLVGDLAHALLVADGTIDLFDQDVLGRVQVLADRIAKVGPVEGASAVKAHVEHGHDVLERGDDRALVGKGRTVEVVDLGVVVVGRSDDVDHVFEVLMTFGLSSAHGCSMCSTRNTSTAKTAVRH
jgi:hypothetical protein